MKTVTVELSERSLAIIYAMMEFIEDGPIGCEAIMGYDGIDDDTVWEDMEQLQAELPELRDDEDDRDKHEDNVIISMGR